MLFISAGGLAAQLFEDLIVSNLQDVVFWSEVETGNDFIKEKYKIIGTDEEVTGYFTDTSRSFVMCIGDISHRKRMTEKFTKPGGKQASFITPFLQNKPLCKKNRFRGNDIKLRRTIPGDNCCRPKPAQ